MENNFDFFVGTWTARHRRLHKVLVGCTDWDEFTSHSTCWSVFDGAGNIDEIVFPDKDYKGLTLRLYDPKTDEWSLYWVNSKLGLSPVPQVGRFGPDGRGVFSADDVYDGIEVKINYIWSEITDNSCRWEQEFSDDGGRTWETNWIMEFTRTGR